MPATHRNAGLVSKHFMPAVQPAANDPPLDFGLCNYCVPYLIETSTVRIHLQCRTKVDRFVLYEQVGAQ